MECILFYCSTEKDKDWEVRSDPPRGNAKHSQKHIHIKKRGCNWEYSWNIDGSRHDAHKFPVNEKFIQTAKKKAAAALGININSLSFLLGLEGQVFATIKEHKGRQLIRTYIKKAENILLFASGTGLAIVIAEGDQKGVNK